MNIQQTDYFQVQLEGAMDLLIPLENMQQVLTFKKGDICPIPGVEKYILGVINQRGRLSWIIELQELFKLKIPEKKINLSNKITSIVLTFENKQMVAVVTKLKGIISLESHNLTTIPLGLYNYQEYFKLQVNLESSLAGVLNIETLFQSLQKNSLPNYIINL